MRRIIALLACVTMMVGCAEEAATTEPGSNGSTPAAETQTTSDAAGTEQKTAAATTADKPAEKVVVIDVRTKAEFDSGHVEGALHIPHTEIADRIAEHVPDKDHKIALY